MRTIKHHSGFTLLEMVLTIGLLAIFVGVSAVVIDTGLTSYLYGQNFTESTEKGRLVLARMTRDLRDINPSALSSFSYTNKVSYRNKQGEMIAYTYTAHLGTLERIVSTYDLMSGSEIVTSREPIATNLDNVVGFVVTYLQEDGVTESGSAMTIRYINIRLLINYPGLKGEVHQSSMQTMIFLRKS